MSLQKNSTPHSIMFPEENNVDGTQDNELKIAILDVFKELKEHMNPKFFAIIKLFTTCVIEDSLTLQEDTNIYASIVQDITASLPVFCGICGK